MSKQGPPWRAVIDPDTVHTNRKAFFVELANGSPGYGTPIVWSDNCGCASRAVRTDAMTAALIAAAPEMLALLRRLAAVERAPGPLDVDRCGFCGARLRPSVDLPGTAVCDGRRHMGAISDEPCPGMAARALISRIDGE